ncbi:MAG: MFS transporter [Proteobacteria bacterium]|nr:MFS transporter [Pseudomonadota bacterium]
MSEAKTFQTGNFVAALVTIATCDVAFGLTLQLQPLLLERLGMEAWLMGTIAAMGPFGILVAGPFLPAIIARFGGKPVAIAALLTILACLGLFPVLQPLYWWFPLRFLLGMAIGTLFTVSETWMLTVSTDANRGRVMGIYTSVLSVTFAVGPLILPYTGIDGLLPWVICMGFVTAALLPMIFVGVRDVAKDEGEGSYYKVIRAAPLLFLCVCTATLFDSVMMSFFTIFAMRNGVPLETASQALGVSIIVGVVFFYPLGLWADRWSKAGVIAVCATATVLAAFAIMPAVSTWAIWPLTAVMACTGFGVYVVALAIIGDIFKGKDVIAASAAVAGMWGIGGIVGPPLAGKIIDVAGINAFGYVVAGFYLMLLAALAASRGRFAVAHG